MALQLTLAVHQLHLFNIRMNYSGTLRSLNFKMNKTYMNNLLYTKKLPHRQEI